jgi:hypothetical protein
LRLLLTLKLAGGSLYLRLMLKRISLAKDMLMTEIEQGREAFLARDLSQDEFPSAFRYYDFIIHMI